MFDPQFTFTNKLVGNIGAIRELIGALNTRRFPNTVLAQFEQNARALSAFSSTSIEGNPLPLTDVKRILKSKPEHARDTELEVLNYNSALIYLDQLIEDGAEMQLSDELICAVQDIVVAGLLPDNHSGKYRTQPVFVNDPRMGQTIYWPPDHQEVKMLMAELLSYINANSGKVEYLILAGIFHQQFVIIHPFMDGNGRTVRLVTKLLLAKMGLNTFHLFSFENYYNANVAKYFQKVGMRGNYYDESTSWDFTEWLEYFTDGIADELTRVVKLLPRATSLSDRIEPHQQKILELLEEKGVIKDSDYARVIHRSRASRVMDFQKLLTLGLIQRHGKGRGTYYTLA